MLEIRIQSLSGGRENARTENFVVVVCGAGVELLAAQHIVLVEFERWRHEVQASRDRVRLLHTRSMQYR